MKTPAVCPDFSLLSQFLDHELGEEEEKAISHHLETCLECRTRVRRMSRAGEVVRAEIGRALSRSLSGAPSRECLTPETISAYVQRVLLPGEEGKVGNHLQTCNVCLNEVMEAFRISSSLAATKKASVPTTLKARVAALWESPSVAAQTTPFSRLVIQIARKGLKLLEQHLVAPLLDVQEVWSPVPAYRAEGEPSALDLRINTGRAEICTMIVREGEGAALKMTLLGAGQEALAGQRISLRQHGKLIFSARTDAEGVLRIPHLEPGIYDVACSGIQTTFQLELRS